MSIANLSVQQLRQAADLKEKIAGLEKQLGQILGLTAKPAATPTTKAPKMCIRDSMKAPDGIVGPYRQPEASYYSYKSTYNPAQVTAGPVPGAAFNGTLPVENRFTFTSLNQCTYDWQLGWYPDANDPSNIFNTSTNALTGGLLVALDSGNFAGPNIAPGATGSLVLPAFPANGGTNYDALRLTDVYKRQVADQPREHLPD